MRILIIDDDHLSIFLTEHQLLLEDATHEVVSFTAASNALGNLITSSPADFPDIIFLDLNMPIMDGWEFLEQLAPVKEALKEKSSIYILTSSLDISDTKRVKDYPMVAGLIHKPITSEDIRVVTEEHLASKNMISK